MPNDARGFSLVELLVALTLLAVLLAAVLGTLVQGRTLASHTDSRSRIQAEARVAMARLERDLRMIGFGVPAGAEIGGSALWTPGIFYASSTGLGFRAEADGGRAAVTCTPKTSNASCPRDEILLDSIAYYDDLNCKRPDDATANLPVVLVHDRDVWEPVTCSGVNTGTDSIDVAPDVTDDTFVAGESEVLTIEQVYYRYVAQSQPPYGRLERHVRYANTPDDTFPPTGITWTVVADHLTDFWLEYRDAGGNAISGSPLSSAQRAQVRRVYFFVEGFDSVGPEAVSQIIQTESEVLVRNAGL